MTTTTHCFDIFYDLFMGTIFPLNVTEAVRVPAKPQLVRKVVPAITAQDFHYKVTKLNGKNLLLT